MPARSVLCALAVMTWGASAHAVASAEVYTREAYQYGRFAARIQFAPGAGVVSSFFLWKDGSEVEGTFWNELDFEKVEAECRVETNALYGTPPINTAEHATLTADLCGEFHTYVYEWTPEYLAWFVDDVEVRRETGERAAAFTDPAADGMQLRFNVWTGDASFGGVLDPSILPVYQYIDWVEYSSYVNGTFEQQWRDDFNAGGVPSRWLRGSWDSPFKLSTHATGNVGVADGSLILALTEDGETGIGRPASTNDSSAPMPSSTSSNSARGSAAGCACRLAPSAPKNNAPLALLSATLVYAFRARRGGGKTR